MRKKARPVSFAYALRRLAQAAHVCRQAWAFCFRPRGSGQTEPLIRYTSRYSYDTREEKGLYVYDKYKILLDNSSILDVGGDRGALQKHLPPSSSYYNIGFGAEVSQEYNLENIPYPFGDNSFDVVLCLDVLEHLENIHAAFDELCRISRKHLIISLPNPYSSFATYLRAGKYESGEKNMKFYGLLPEPEEDRHRWFFSPPEAQAFIRSRAEKNHFSITQFDAKHLSTPRKRRHTDDLYYALFRPDLDISELEISTMWWVLEKLAVSPGQTGSEK